MDLFSAFISAHIVLNKLQNTEFLQFSQIFTQKYAPAESTLRKYLYFDDCHKKMMKTITDNVCLKKM